MVLREAFHPLPHRRPDVLSALTVNRFVTQALIDTEPACGDLGMVEENGRQIGFVVLYPGENIPSDVTAWGFDDAWLDMLFLVMPVSWRGTLTQYVGRLHPEKRDVVVYDYVDEAVPVLRRMGDKRVRGYRNLGYSIERPGLGIAA